MSDQAVLTEPRPESISASLQERIRAFTSFYEQHAYLAHNLALRIACAQAAAESAVQRGFLRQVGDRPAGLLAATVEAAMQEAVATADAGAAGDPEAQALLNAISTLPPAERAALALADLADADAEGIGEALGVPAAQAGQLLDRGRDAFATALGVSRPQADEAARDWMWAAPPNEVWEELYSHFHTAVERQLRRGSAEQTLVLKPDSATAPPAASRAAKRRLKRASSTMRRPRWARRPHWSVVLPAAFLLLALAVGAATQLGGSSDSGGSQPASDQSGTAPGSADPLPSGPATGEDDAVKPHKPLTAALLDKLRLRELRQLRDYGRRQADTSLPARQRRAASRRITALERAARARLLAQQRREAALRDRQARQNARTQAPPPPPTSPRRTTPAAPTTPPRTQTPAPGAPPADRDDAEQKCLRDESTGQYICPQG